MLLYDGNVGCLNNRIILNNRYILSYTNFIHMHKYNNNKHLF